MTETGHLGTVRTKTVSGPSLFRRLEGREYMHASLPVLSSNSTRRSFPSTGHALDQASNLCPASSMFDPDQGALHTVKLTLGSREHLYRRHQPPIQCPRCWTDMQDNQELENHLRLTSQCELRSRPSFLGICPRKLELLKTKKRQSSDPSEEGKWRAVFRILFPGADIPCPCKFKS
jgi:hypothetical protein